MSIIEFLNAKKVDTGTINPCKKSGIDYLDDFLSNAEEDELSLLTSHSLKELAAAYFTSLAPENLENNEFMVRKYTNLFSRKNLEVLRMLVYLATDRDFLKAYYSTGLNIATLNEATSAISCKYQFETMSSIKFLIRFFFNLNSFREFVDFFRNISFSTRQAGELCTILFTADDIQKALHDFGNTDLTNKSLKKTEKKLGRAGESYNYFHFNCLERKKEYAKEIREVNKYNNTLQKVIATLERYPNYISPDEVEKLLHLGIDNETKHAILDYVYSINSKNEEAISKAYEQAKTSSKEVLIEMLTSYKIDYKSLTKEEIENLKSISSLKLREMLEFFFKYQIPLDSVASLAYFDPEVIEEVTRLLQNGVLTAKFIGENLSMLEKNSALYKLITINLGLLSSMEINIRNYPESLDILLTDLSYPLFLLSKYKINITNRTKDISFLKDPDLEAKLDLLLETGNDLNSLPSYDVLNNSLSMLYLSLLSSSLDIEYSEELYASFDAYNLMPKCNLLVPEALQTAFASNHASSSLPDGLERYVINPNILVINGVFVSISRVLKNISCINPDDSEELFYAIIYGSYYNLGQVTLIKEEIEGINRSI